MALAEDLRKKKFKKKLALRGLFTIFRYNQKLKYMYTSILFLVDVVSAVINARHGWAVADQFKDSFEGQSFDKQNYNALRYIQAEVKVILQSDLLSEEAQLELEEYKEELDNYLSEN